MPKKTKVEKKAEIKDVPKLDSQKPSFYQAVGRRKEATCRVKLYVSADNSLTINGNLLKKGEIIINSRPIETYFPGQVYKKYYLEPFRTTNTLGRFATSAIIAGGGSAGQLGAFVHGVSRALEKVDREKYRPILKSQGFITRDSRIKERRKAGNAQKARAKKQSPKR